MLDDFSHEHLLTTEPLEDTISALNYFRDEYLKTRNKVDWWQLIQLLPSSYNQERTVRLDYRVLGTIYYYQKNHELDEWKEFCAMIEELPYSELITQN